MGEAKETIDTVENLQLQIEKLQRIILLQERELTRAETVMSTRTKVAETLRAERAAQESYITLAQSELADKAEFIDTLIEQAPVGITVYDYTDDGIRFIDCNTAVLEIYGTTREFYSTFFGSPGHSPEFQPDGSNSVEKSIEITKKVLAGETMRLNWVHCMPDGTPIPLELTLTRVMMDGNYVGIGYIYDLRNQVMLQEQIEEQIKEVEAEQQKLQQILDLMPVGVRVMRISDGMLTYANEASLKVFGCESFEEQVAGNVGFKFMPEVQPDGTKTVDLVADVFLKDSFTVEMQCLKLSGKPFIARINSSKVDYQGEPSSLATVEDVTARKEMETQLVASNMRLNLLVKSLDVALWDFGVDPKNSSAPVTSAWFSPEFRQMLGYDAEDEFPDEFSSWRDRLHPDDVNRVLSVFYEHIMDTTEQTRYNVEYRLLHKNGEYRYFHAFGETLRDHEGVPIRVAGAINDIHEQKLLQESMDYRTQIIKSLHEATEVFSQHDGRTFDEVMTNGIYVVADSMGVDRVHIFKQYADDDNPKQVTHESVYLWDRKEGGTVSPEICFASVHDVPIPKKWIEILNSGDHINKRVSGMTKEDAKLFAKHGVKTIFMAPIFVHGNLWGIISLEDHDEAEYFDEGSTELNLLQSAAQMFADAIIRKEMLEQANAASKAKGDFLSNMSHEMRTPLNAIVGMTAIGKKSEDMEMKNHALNKISDASTHLLGVVNDILDMTKIEANKLELHAIDFNFERVLQRVISGDSYRTEEKQLAVTVKVDRGIPRFLRGDSQRLAQVITNLFSNAVKFTPEQGKIHMEATLVNEVNRVCEICIEVSDTGIGMSEEHKKALFVPFGQAKSDISRDYGGTGLGLVISKRIIEQMEGEIDVVSELGKGSKFVFTFKMLRGKKKLQSLLAPGVNAKNVRVLVVDDMAETRVQFREVFKQLDVTCDVAADGLQACRLVKERGDYDIYFIDLQMPKMDGIELTRWIKSRQVGRPSVVTMITVTEWNRVKDEAHDAGVDMHLLKPFFSSSIIDCINECLGVNEEESHAVMSGEFADKKMLLVEDIEINREILIALLEDTQIQIDSAENGIEALDLVAAEPDKYNIILMDIQMPRMDGLEATRRICELPGFCRERTPIVALTANVFTSDIADCLDAGMVDHLGKPIDMDLLIKKMRMYLQMS
ncbi:MAG: response regulator [Lachnospiraceae bacterium]|jgi:PAS domain S-box-containing protein|nr:response regulator [Lachnospiraceae bacterium]